MDQNKSALERAFEMAKSGQFENVKDLRTGLVKEGYLPDQIVGRTLVTQLKGFMTAAASIKAS